MPKNGLADIRVAFQPKFSGPQGALDTKFTEAQARDWDMKRRTRGSLNTKEDDRSAPKGVLGGSPSVGPSEAGSVTQNSITFFTALGIAQKARALNNHAQKENRVQNGKNVTLILKYAMLLRGMGC